MNESESEVKTLIENINKKKLEMVSYKTEIQTIETSLNNYSLFLRAQLSLILFEEYIEKDPKKADTYSKTTKEYIIKCFDNNILSIENQKLFCNMLCKVYVNDLKSIKTTELIIEFLKDLRKKDFFAYIKKSPNEMFVYLHKRIIEDEIYELLDYIPDYITTKQDIDTIFKAYLVFEKLSDEFVENMDKVTVELSDHILIYKLFYRYRIEILEEVCSLFLKEIDFYHTMKILIFNTINSKKNFILEKIFNFLDQKNIKRTETDLFKVLFIKLTKNGSSLPPNHKETLSYNILLNEYKEDLVSFFFLQNKYDDILQLDPPLISKFICYLKLNRLKDAKNLYNDIIVSKYNNLLTNEGQFVKIPEKYLFLMYLLNEENNQAIQILEKIESIETFIECSKECYKNKNMYVLAECIRLGIKKFKDKNIEFIKVVISFLHLEGIHMEKSERISLIVELIENVNFQDLFQTDNEFFYNICYNNAIDCIHDKIKQFSKLFEILLKINQCLNLELVQLYISAHKQNLFFKDFEKYDIIEDYSQMETKDINCSIDLFEITDNENIIDFIKPVSKLSSKKLRRCLLTQTKHLNFKRVIFDEVRKRNALDQFLVQLLIDNLTIYGPIVLYEYMNEIEKKLLTSNHIETLITKQIEFLKITKNYELESKFLNLLETIKK